MSFSVKHLKLKLIVKNALFASSCCEKILGVKVEHKLSFEPHIESLCQKASQKLKALPRMASSLKFKLRKLLLNVFITAPVFLYTSCLDVSC